MRAALLFIAVAGCGSEPLGDVPAPDAPPPCGCGFRRVRLAGAVTPAGANELSGLAASLAMPGVVWTHNDNGDSARLFALTTHGAGLGIGILPGATADDWEDLATAPCGATSCIYVADTGDNLRTRASVRIYEVPEPAEIRGMVELDYRAFDITYPGGQRDAEALFVDPRDGASYVLTKEQTGPATVFRMPRVTGAPAMAVAVATFAVPSGDNQITASDLHVDSCGVGLLIRTYSSLWKLAGAPDETIEQLFARAPSALPVAVEPQGESVAFLPEGHAYLTVTEGTDARVSVVACE